MKTPALSKSALLLRDTYQLYAKMLAVENIKVVFDEAISAPAQFDILNRILYISPVHQSQAHLIPGLVIHEVGHALYSTLTEAEAKKLKRITKLLNIIDDGYQERMMCKKYANAKKHLFTVFDEFFIKTGDAAYITPNKLINIVNILNYNCKGFKHGYSKPYPSYLLPEDLPMLKEAEMINEPSFMERNEFAKRLAKILKKYGEMPEEDQELGDGKSKSKSKGDGESEESDDAPLMDDDDADSDTGSEDGDDEDVEEDDAPKKKSKGSNGDKDEDEVDELLESNSDKLNDHHEKFKHQMNGGTSFELPTGKDLWDFAEITDIYEKGQAIDTALLDTKNFNLVDKYQKALKEAKKVAGKIYTRFNARVQASNYANTQYKRSGTLDPERAALYQVYDDVFQKTAIEQNQSNHAYTIMLDWSGSMDSSLYALALRIMELVYFAKSAGIEVEVWLYTTAYANKFKTIHKNIATMQSRFYKVLNTKKNTPMELDQRVKHFFMIANEICSTSGPKIKGDDASYFIKKFGTQGTNILEGLIFGHYQLAQMQADVKTCFLLTDGSDNTYFDTYWKGSTQGRSNAFDNVKKKVYVNGVDVDYLFDSGTTRVNATKAIAAMYLEAGQRTTGIAWNCSGRDMKEYAQNVVATKSASPHGSHYLHADNIFIDEIVKRLL